MKTRDTTSASNADPREHSPSAERNRDAILAVLRNVLPQRGTVLEIASGTGQHAIHFAAALPGVAWQPSDADAAARASIAAWTAHSGLTNIRPPLDLDVCRNAWGIDAAHALVCINMIHISPWAATEALIDGAARVLDPGGVLFLYGPYRRGGAHTASSNEAFDLQLRSRNPAWGVRDMEAVAQLAGAAGFAFDEPLAMPANNFSVVFRKR
jgi:SAM-dependent methyltransferase